MFQGCLALMSLDYTTWNSASLTTTASMFNDCKSLKQITFGPHWHFISGNPPLFPQANQANDPRVSQEMASGR